MKPYRGPRMSLGAAAAAQVRLIICCTAWRHQVEPDPAEMAARYGADASVLDWRADIMFKVLLPQSRFRGGRYSTAIA